MDAAQTVHTLSVPSQPVAAKRWRLRFSLATLCCFFVAIACLVLLGLSYLELSALRGENSRMRAELGILTVTDPHKLYALGVRTTEDTHWIWRVYIPEGKPYDLFFSIGMIPLQTLPADLTHAAGKICKLPPGQHAVRAALRKESGGEYELFISLDDDQMEFHYGLQVAINQVHVQFAGGYPGDLEGAILGCNRNEYVGFDKQVSLDPLEGPLVLLRRTCGKTPQSDPAPGTLIWIAPETSGR